MARALRIEVPGGWYHVVNRGLERRQIFASETEYRHFLALISRLPERFGVKVHGYVLMPNHYHLQVETPRANLSQAIHWLNVSYGGWYNRLNNRVGPLFQGRFKAVLHDYDSAALTINHYIHLNPVRVSAHGGNEGRQGLGWEKPSRELAQARIAALSYPWSSYLIYAGKQSNPGWLTTEAVYGFFGEQISARLRGVYRRQLEEFAALGEWHTDWKEEVKATVLYGSGEFVERMRKLLQGNRNEQIGVRKSSREALNWKEICRVISEVWQGDWEKLAATRGNGALPAAWYIGQNFGGMRLNELGEAAGGVAYPAVSAAIIRFEKRLEIDRKLRNRIRAVRTKLSV